MRPSTRFFCFLAGCALLIYPRFRLTPFFDPCQVSTLFLLTVIPYVAATVLPSWGPATGDPGCGDAGLIPLHLN